LHSHNTELLHPLLETSTRELSNAVIQMAIELRDMNFSELILIACRSKHPSIRQLGASLLKNSGELWTNSELVQRLRADCAPSVRREVLLFEAGNRPAGAIELWRKALLDRNGTLRGLARYSLKELGEQNLAHHYRAALSSNRNDRTALSGLSETCDSSDAELFTAELQSPFAKRRCIALRALARLDGEAHTNTLIEAVDDPAPTVSREAYRLARTAVRAPHIELVESIAQRCKHGHSWRNALSLLKAFGKWPSISKLIRATTHSDSQFRIIAWREFESWFEAPLLLRVFTKPTSAEIDDIQTQLERARLALPFAQFSKMRTIIEEAFR
jgi:hypothetical protein